MKLGDLIFTIVMILLSLYFIYQAIQNKVPIGNIALGLIIFFFFDILNLITGDDKK